MKFSLSVHYDLSQFFALLHHPCGVFLVHFEHGCHQLLSILWVDGLNRTCIFRVGIFNKIEPVFAVFPIKSITRLYVFQFNRTTNITCIELIYSNAIGSSASIELSDTFFRTAIGIGKVISWFNTTAHHFEIRYFTNVGFHSCFEEIDRSRCTCFGWNLFATCIVELRHFADKWNDIT